jgi:uncharacterized repeat protein (TIGR03803 family)
MKKLDGCKRTCILLMSAAMMVIAAQAQTFTTLWNFDWADGANPINSLVQGTDGSLYAPTIMGGAGSTNNCCGTVFRITPKGALTRLHSFCSHNYCEAGYAPDAALVLGSDGNFYGGTIYGGANRAGTIFKIAPTGTLTVVHTFDLNDGSSLAGLIQTNNGTFYGTTSYGGTGSGPGTFFEMTSDGTLTTLYDFGADGSLPGPLVEGSDGNFYGSTTGGGTYEAGTIFKITPAGALTTLHDFNVTDGNAPDTQLIQATDGNLYGTTPWGGANCSRTGGCGTIFKITPGGSLTTLYSFCAQPHCTDGTVPNSGLIQATDGNFYGATSFFGAYGYGTIFRMTLDGKITTLHSFNSTDGSTAEGGLVQATNGVLYGTTRFGGSSGASGNGTVFSLDVGLRPFISFVRASGYVGQTVPILGQGFTGTTGVSFNGTPASFTVVSDTFLKATVPAGATTGFVTATMPSGTLTSNVMFRVMQ